jgi:hypothetical protein
MLLAPSLLATPFLALKPISRILRKIAGEIVRQEAVGISVDVTKWHEYSIQWLCDCAQFKIDDETILKTSITPHPPLGLVLWIDNQFAAWTPKGQLGYGTLDNPAAYLDINLLRNV